VSQFVIPAKFREAGRESGSRKFCNCCVSLDSPVSSTGQAQSRYARAEWRFFFITTQPRKEESRRNWILPYQKQGWVCQAGMADCVGLMSSSTFIEAISLNGTVFHGIICLKGCQAGNSHLEIPSPPLDALPDSATGERRSGLNHLPATAGKSGCMDGFAPRIAS